MFVCKTRKWGNSLGLLIPRQEAEKMNLQENREVLVDVVEKDNPFKELFGFGKRKRITRKQVQETRKLFESGRF